MKTALILFHKNLSRYPIGWIAEYKNSIRNQSYRNFSIYELNYGGGEERIFEESFFDSVPMADHAEAHNYLIDDLFKKDYDLILNTNVDDVYPLDRVEIQVSSFDSLIPVSSGNYVGFRENNKYSPTSFHTMNIGEEFKKDHNIIAHPACAYTKSLLDYNESLISNEIPSDDFQMWKRLLGKGCKFNILPNVLLYYRISDLKTGN